TIIPDISICPFSEKEIKDAIFQMELNLARDKARDSLSPLLLKAHNMKLLLFHKTMSNCIEIFLGVKNRDPSKGLSPLVYDVLFSYSKGFLEDRCTPLYTTVEILHNFLSQAHDGALVNVLAMFFFFLFSFLRSGTEHTYHILLMNRMVNNFTNGAQYTAKEHVTICCVGVHF
ncbi:hypothetical protein ACJX0J_013299, partial [Zea mays]